jgi:hypothetical protein
MGSSADGGDLISLNISPNLSEFNVRDPRVVIVGERHLRAVILDHGCESGELLFLAMAVDGGFRDHRVKLRLTRPCHAGQRKKREDRTETKSRNWRLPGTYRERDHGPLDCRRLDRMLITGEEPRPVLVEYAPLQHASPAPDAIFGAPAGSRCSLA